jgi:hypothetical protein
MARGKGDFAIAADLASQSHPGRRGSFSAHAGIIDRYLPFVPLWIFEIWKLADGREQNEESSGLRCY